jgi:hypothetical protein
MDTSELVREFADCVVARNAAVAEADPLTANKFARRCAAAFESLRALGDPGRDALTVLLDDNRAEVRVMAAAHLLRHCHDRATAVLESESRGTGLVAFGAAQALQRWKEGTWALDPK